LKTRTTNQYDLQGVKLETRVKEKAGRRTTGADKLTEPALANHVLADLTLGFLNVSSH
jgi:hypothetical protein